MSDNEARAREWRDLCEKDDQTSPPEYPDMALVSFDEFLVAMTAAAPALTKAAVEAEREGCAKVAETEKTMFFYPPEKEANRRKTVHGERIASAIRARKEPAP